MEFVASKDDNSKTKTKKKSKFYAIANGRQTGIFNNWDDVEEKVINFADAQFKSFKSEQEAITWLDENLVKNVDEVYSSTDMKTQCLKDFVFTPLQQLAFDKYSAGENIFITGPGGSGKSALIKAIVENAKKRNKHVQVCGMTGCAAVLLDGCNAKTLHSWAGIGLANGDIDIISHRVMSDKYKARNWKRVDLLIVDEVSMMSQKIFNLLNITGKKCRKNDKLFGGIQVIFSGDFFQLPPVGNIDEPETCNFCFESPTFEELFPGNNKIYFDKIFRQKDPVYSKILNQIRVGKISKNSIRILEKYVKRPVVSEEDIKPTVILPLKRMVDKINKTSLSKIKEEIHCFETKCVKEPMNEKQEKYLNKLSEAQIKGEFKFLQSSITADDKLILKKGAQVMCIVNLNVDDDIDLICNGSQGIIEGFQDGTGFPIVKFRNGSTRIMGPHRWESEQHPGLAVKQIPLILSWAITIHKAQGASIELAEIDIGSNIFAAGQTYVALSRVISLDGLYLRNFDYTRIKINKKVRDFYKEL